MANRSELRVYFSPHRPSALLCSRFVACSEMRVIGRSRQGYRLKRSFSSAWDGVGRWIGNDLWIIHLLGESCSLLFPSDSGTGAGRQRGLWETWKGVAVDAVFFSFSLHSLSDFFEPPLLFPHGPALSLFPCIPRYSLPRSYLAYTFFSFSISAYRVFFRVVFFLYLFFLRFLSATYFSFALPPSSHTLVPSRFEIGLGWI